MEIFFCVRSITRIHIIIVFHKLYYNIYCTTVFEKSNIAEEWRWPVHCTPAPSSLRRVESTNKVRRECRGVGAAERTPRTRVTGRRRRLRRATVSTAAVRSWTRCMWWPAWAFRSGTAAFRTRTWALCAGACRTPRSGCTCACARVCWPHVVAPAWPPADGFSSMTPLTTTFASYRRCSWNDHNNIYLHNSPRSAA